MENRQLLEQIVTSLDKHKASDLRVLEITDITSIADFFVLATGTSTTQVKALADYVETDLKNAGVSPLRVEGYASSSWILMDYGSVLVHVFKEETRRFYDLERLWQDGKPREISEFLNDGGKQG